MAKEVILIHHGIKGQKLGVRRYQNKDGSLTATGRKRTQRNVDRISKAVSKRTDSTDNHSRSIYNNIKKMIRSKYDKDTVNTGHAAKNGKVLSKIILNKNRNKLLNTIENINWELGTNKHNEKVNWELNTNKSNKYQK